MLSARARDELHAHLDSMARRHKKELAAGRAEVDLPHALRAKTPRVATCLAWPHLFPFYRPCTYSATGRQVLYLHGSGVQSTVHDAGRAARLAKRATCHMLRHSFATHLNEARTEVGTIHAVLGDKDARTTMIYTRIIDRGPFGVISRLDR